MRACRSNWGHRCDGGLVGAEASRLGSGLTFPLAKEDKETQCNEADQNENAAYCAAYNGADTLFRW